MLQTKGQLTMPEAMLLAKLTLCSHGNGSCWPPVRKERTKSKESKCLHQMSKWAQFYPCNHDYSVLNSANEWGALDFTCTRFIYSVLLPVDVPSGPPRSREPTYHSRVDFRSTSSHTVNTSVLSLRSVCSVVALRCAGTAGGGIDG